MTEQMPPWRYHITQMDKAKNRELGQEIYDIFAREDLHPATALYILQELAKDLQRQTGIRVMDSEPFPRN